MASRSAVAAKALYRSLLRAHTRYLPNEMRELGDAYIKAEFKLHRTVTKPEQLDNFFNEWEAYLDQVVMTARAKESISTGSLDADKATESVFSFGKDLPQNLDLSTEQAEQLKKLREEATSGGK
jgi:hypothetical protein